jgi:acyl carrier protein
MNAQLSESETQAVYDLLAKQLDLKREQIALDARIQEDLGADSLDVMEIILACEERFSLAIPDEASERVSTVGDLLETLGDLLHPRGRGA